MAGNIKFDCVDIGAGFWGKLQTRNKNVTIHSVYDRFCETGRVQAFAHTWKEGERNRPHIFWDSDVAKWMESAAYILRKDPTVPKLEAQVEAIIDNIERNQDADGYFNSYFQVVEPEKRWQIRAWHELYCAGHLIEAAVAWHDTTGRDRFLRCMMKYADYIERVFVIDKSAAFTSPGHEEIELALVKLWCHTGEERYLKLAEFFLDQRGTTGVVLDDRGHAVSGTKNIQDHMPVREQTEAVGHSVRAMYLYRAMADVAGIRGDAVLRTACEKIWDSAVNRRMYITGGIGSTRVGEAFSLDYDLPNASAYAETCAAIALAFFATRMNELKPDGKYADVIERVLYNGFLSSTSLEGDSFFYENPLEIDLDRNRARDAVGDTGMRPITQRVRVFNCSCCPPNITRFVAELGDFLYTTDDTTVYVNQYTESTADFDGITIAQQTNYPHDGKITLKVTGMAGKTLAVRIPGWCGEYTCSHTGTLADGYLRIPGADEMTVTLELAMPVTLIESRPEVHENAGRVALTRGPLVYCLEGVDNGPHLRDLAVLPEGAAQMEYDAKIGAYIIEVPGCRRDPARFHKLYEPYSRARRQDVRLRFIPYYAFANRGESDMLVWVRTA